MHTPQEGISLYSSMKTERTVGRSVKMGVLAVVRGAVRVRLAVIHSAGVAGACSAPAMAALEGEGGERGRGERQFPLAGRAPMGRRRCIRRRPVGLVGAVLVLLLVQRHVLPPIRSLGLHKNVALGRQASRLGVSWRRGWRRRSSLVL